MIIHSHVWKKFERKIQKTQKLSIKQAFKIMDALHQEALKVDGKGFRNPLEGIEIDIKVAKVVNSV